MSTGTNTGGNGGLLGLLQILFIGLKLAGVIDWSWFWVLSPIIGVVIVILLALAVLCAVVVARDK